MRPIHMASVCNAAGGVSALCFKKPRAINLRIATWTNREEAVTCPSCKLEIEHRRAAP